VLPVVTTLAEWLRHYNGLAVGETAAPACFLRENAEGEGMPPLLSLRNDQTRSHQSERESSPREHVYLYLQ
jgi:hypothetical protein